MREYFRTSKSRVSNDTQELAVLKYAFAAAWEPRLCDIAFFIWTEKRKFRFPASKVFQAERNFCTYEFKCTVQRHFDIQEFYRRLRKHAEWNWSWLGEDEADFLPLPALTLSIRLALQCSPDDRSQITIQSHLDCIFAQKLQIISQVLASALTWQPSRAIHLCVGFETTASVFACLFTPSTWHLGKLITPAPVLSPSQNVSPFRERSVIRNSE